MDGVTGEHFSYGALQTDIVRVASALVKLGVRQGDIVTLLLGNCIQYPVIYLAVTAIGAIASPLNPVYTPGGTQLFNK